jgi:hypothetical protein
MAHKSLRSVTDVAPMSDVRAIYGGYKTLLFLLQRGVSDFYLTLDHIINARPTNAIVARNTCQRFPKRIFASSRVDVMRFSELLAKHQRGRKCEGGALPRPATLSRRITHAHRYSRFAASVEARCFEVQRTGSPEVHPLFQHATEWCWPHSRTQCWSWIRPDELYRSQ